MKVVGDLVIIVAVVVNIVLQHVVAGEQVGWLSQQ